MFLLAPGNVVTTTYLTFHEIICIQKEKGLVYRK